MQHGNHLLMMPGCLHRWPTLPLSPSQPGATLKTEARALADIPVLLGEA